VNDSEDGSITKGIDPAKVIFTADYLERGRDVTEIMQGHQANAEASAHLVGKALLEGSDCKSCHNLTEKSVGPSFTNIADKYAGEEAQVKRLAEKVIKGGSGVWGDLMMSPHPQLSTDDTEKMIRYILSLNAKTKETALPYKGKYALNKHKAGDKEGTYIFTASYTDKGSNGMKPLTATKIVSLSYPLIPANRFKEAKKTASFLVTRDMWKELKEDMTIVLPSHEGMIRYGNIDFTDVGQITFGLAVAPTYFSGGKLELYLDNADGAPFATADFDIGLTDLGFKELAVNMPDTKGVHDLILKVKCKDPNKVFAGFANLEFKKRK
jgi:cytochrome c